MVEGLPERIKKAMKLSKKKIPDLVEETGFSAWSISCWRRGATSPSAEALLEVSKALGVSADWLLKG